MEYMKLKSVVAVAVLAVITGGLFMSCRSMCTNVKSVSGFDLEKFLGEWYEIARYDFKYEKNMSHVKARYTMNENGTINIENSGFDYIDGKQKTRTGKAKFAGEKNEGKLKVSFFGPFYSAYNIVALDKNYNYALIAGDNLNLLWILSRTPEIPDDVKENYLNIARQIGYDVDKLVWTIQ